MIGTHPEFEFQSLREQGWGGEERGRTRRDSNLERSNSPDPSSSLLAPPLSGISFFALIQALLFVYASFPGFSLFAVALCARILLAIFVASSLASLPLLSFRKLEKKLEVFVLAHFAVLCCWDSGVYIFVLPCC